MCRNTLKTYRSMDIYETLSTKVENVHIKYSDGSAKYKMNLLDSKLCKRDLGKGILVL